MPMLSALDRLIAGFDRGLRTLAQVHTPARPSPGEDVSEADLTDADRAHAAALMRVNHCGEVCAQGLYQGQALASTHPTLVRALERAAREEEDHLAWTADRVHELGGRLSVLNPLWYAGSLALGFAAGKLGDKWNLGFLKETERQVEAHLQSHLDRLNPTDRRTRTVVEQMQADERGHAETAARLGAAELPAPAKLAMRLGAKVMTTASYYV
jgi:3-demethoxyubiquinol 3-hydroxylase